MCDFNNINSDELNSESTNVNLIGQILNGKEFKNIFGDIFYKVLNKNLIHWDYKYIDGLNICPQTFNPSGQCSPGGLYFTMLKCMPMWVNYKSAYIVRVQILDDSIVYIENNKFKTDKFQIDLSTKCSISKFEYLTDDKFRKLAIEQNYLFLNYIRNQTPELCELAVKNDPFALKHIRNQTFELCEFAVKKDPLVLKYIRNQTSELCEFAVKNNPLVLKFVRNQTPKICELAVENDPFALKYVHNQTPEICELAVRSNGFALKFVRNQTSNICKLAVKTNNWALRYIRDKKNKLLVIN